MIARVASLLLFAGVGGCAPMTFSEEGEIDFRTYASVRVVVDAPMLADPSGYLTGELRESSGFERVTTDPNESVELILNASVSVEQRVESDDEVKWDGDASFRAATPEGRVVLEGDESDTSESESEAAEDVLDEVALHFLAPYRI